MQRYTLTRIMQYTEVTEVEAENWGSAVKMLTDPETEFSSCNDDFVFDDNVEYIGEVE